MVHMLKARVRELRGDRARTTEQLPGVVYGGNTASQPISLEYAQFLKLYKSAGESSLINFDLDGQDGGKVLIQEVAYHPVSGKIIHVDLRRIDMNKAMTATVELKFVGEPPVVKASGGTLVTNINSVAVKCLPKDLVSAIEVDLSGLDSYDKVIKVRDIVVPAGIEITSPNADDLVGKATPALTEEELKKMEEAGPTDLSQIEMVEKKKKEEDGEEGAAAAPTEAKKDEKK